MAAANSNSSGQNQARTSAGATAQRVEHSCWTAIEGRRAARLLADWVRHFELTEPEFQVLWHLRQASKSAVDQKTLACGLAFSAAQISASVERLRARGWIAPQPMPGDRRRHLWRLSASGQELLATMIAADRASFPPEAAA